MWWGEGAVINFLPCVSGVFDTARVNWAGFHLRVLAGEETVSDVEKKKKKRLKNPRLNLD